MSDNKKKISSILIVWPLGSPFYPSDFWRCTLLYEVASHIRKLGFSVDVFDGYNHKTYSDLFKMLLTVHYDAVIINAPLDIMDGFIKTLKYLRLLDSSMPIYVYGLSTLISPKTFNSFDIQGYSNSGYFEIGILSFLGYYKEVVSCVLKQDGEWKEYPRIKGTPGDWSFMDVKDALKFQAIGMSISRGCQGGCNFCSHALLHGKNDIRKPCKEICDYLEALEKNGYSGLVEFMSPTFTINKEWVKEFCSEYIKRRLKIKWRCVTRVDQVESDIVKKMSEANCVRIGLGVETMNAEEQKALKKVIRQDLVFHAIEVIKDNNIKVLTYLISGIEPQNGKNLKYTYNILKAMGTTPRVSALLRYSTINFDDMIDVSIASDMSTSSLNKITGMSNYDLIKLIIGIEDIDAKII